MEDNNIMENSETAEEIMESAAVEEEKKKSLPTQTSLTIRVVVGGYILYTMYQVFTSGSVLSIWMVIAAGLLAITSAALVVTSFMHFIKGEYEGGKADKNR